MHSARLLYRTVQEFFQERSCELLQFAMRSNWAIDNPIHPKLDWQLWQLSPSTGTTSDFFSSPHCIWINDRRSPINELSWYVTLANSKWRFHPAPRPSILAHANTSDRRTVANANTRMTRLCLYTQQRSTTNCTLQEKLLRFLQLNPLLIDLDKLRGLREKFILKRYAFSKKGQIWLTYNTRKPQPRRKK